MPLMRLIVTAAGSTQRRDDKLGIIRENECFLLCGRTFTIHSGYKEEEKRRQNVL